MVEATQPTRTVKVALVLYGGVSLAVYENGVTRSFFDLVKGRGVFGFLLELLDAKAEVDVIAGTSAGGINGLILAAALESGTEFAESAEIWRKLGDFGALLRKVDGDGNERSLLDGDGFYLKQLIEGFTKFCRMGDRKYEYAGEIDLFITGTELQGTLHEFQDDAGRTIVDRTHRAVFHLKHRGNRRHLGLAAVKAKDTDDNEQAHVLAALARITSCFPAAFPAFTVKEMPAGTRKAVLKALNATRRLRSEGVAPYGENSAFIDGGVLDNKPFGPALNAIFNRMPSGPVDRKLFFIEPDPEPPQAVDEAAAPDEPAKPISVAIQALTTIPGHESITGDLEQLKRHNNKIAFLQEVERKVMQQIYHSEPSDERLAPAEAAVYRRTRIESLARLVAGVGDQATSADQRPAEAWRSALMDQANAWLIEFFERPNGSDDDEIITKLNRFDIDYVRRYAFHLLYRYYEALTTAPDDERLRRLVETIGWHIKVVEVTRSALDTLRNDIFNDTAPNHDAVEIWTRLLIGISQLLDASADHWQALRHALNDPDAAAGAATATDRRQDGALGWDPKEVFQAVGEISQAPAVSTLNTGDLTAETILDLIVTSLVACVRTLPASKPSTIDFGAIDRQLYPLKFAAGVHELDQIEFIRVSPADAQIGHSQRPANDKISGDTLAHFSAFMRRDWRGNDILWGRLDGICQIIAALLDQRALVRLRRSGPAPDRDLIDHYLPGAPEAARAALMEAWVKMIEAWGTSTQEADTFPETQRFISALILAGQEEASETDLPGVLTDHYAQEIVWGRTQPNGITRGAGPTAIEGQAQREAAAHAAHLETSRARFFASAPFGSQKVTEEVPHQIIGEYATRAYLIFWEMLSDSLGGSRRFLNGPARRWFRHPVLFANRLLRLIHDETLSAATVISALTALLAGGFVLAVANGAVGYALAALAGLVAFIWLFVASAVGQTKARLWWTVIRSGLLAFIVTAAVLVGAELLGDLFLCRLSENWPSFLRDLLDPEGRCQVATPSVTQQ